ncbi:hypothetical protein HJC23_008535 [Cyclotella cryptica]|uniref:4a-hydroxytetrahydrobiopterin dehydratase n=1 Tax=Cyclotella cryptica TaxID=29204 RepID=A0ABD3R5V3_9STRA|eukprot:CCRYP_001304-RA/>CCRYP_001304-RA protein AED:0.00 eAED:0.00 QI:263/-1/1/1/-1/1/1/269/240
MIASISRKARCSTVTKVLFYAEPRLLGLTPCLHVSSRQRCIPTIVWWTSPARRFTRPFSNADTPSSGSNRDRLDPTAKRPTTKCDPYGLSGQSLSYTECHNLLGTLADGWRLMYAADMPETLGNAQVNEESDTTNSTHSLMTPSFLQKQFYHDSFYDASRFLSHVSLLATNINHYPYLSMERVLVDDLNQFQNSIRESNDHGGDDDDDGGSGIKKLRRKIKGMGVCQHCSMFYLQTFHKE